MNHHSAPPPHSNPAGPTGPGGPSSGPASGQHIATIGEEGRFWDVYVEFDDDETRMDSYGARLCFAPADSGNRSQAVRTATILIEPSYEEVLYRARGFEAHQLAGLLRSCLPDDPS
jgi:hypothetical protein